MVLAADQFVKYLTITYLPLEEVVPVLGGFLQLYFVRNPGAAFSLGAEVTWIFTIALLVVAALILWKTFAVRSRLWAVVLGCLLGGVLGNLGDRLFREPGFAVGHVVDMISMPWMMPAIFNVADVFIVTSMISVALLVVFGLRFDGTRDRDHVEAAAPGSDADGSVDAADTLETTSTGSPTAAGPAATDDAGLDRPAEPRGR